MAVSLKDLKKAKATTPPRVMIYGPPKTGKTTLCANAPSPIFLQTEEGTPAGVDLTTFGLIESYDQLMESMRALAVEDHDFKTLVLDSIEATEPLVNRQVCMEKNWADIEEPGFGKGYVAAADKWNDVMKATDFLRKNKGMNIVFLGHSDVRKFQPPGSEPYNRFTLRVHQRVGDLLGDQMDIIGFLNQKTEIKQTDQGFGKKVSLRIPRAFGHQFHGDLATRSMNTWPPVPRHLATPG